MPIEKLHQLTEKFSSQLTETIDRCSVDYLSEGRRLNREDFIAKYPFYFLAPLSAVVSPTGPGITRVGPPRKAAPAPDVANNPHLPLAIRKVQPTFPNMITIGRTYNNDMVLRDTAISKFHAFFRVFRDGIELVDAGSRNGTFVGSLRIAANDAIPVTAGELIRLGPLQFKLVDANSVWDTSRGTASSSPP